MKTLHPTAKKPDPPGLTHLDPGGAVRMVDVGGKPVSLREAIASGRIRLAAETLRLIDENRIAKGNVLATARIAGIQAAKQTAMLIPLCHPLQFDHLSVDFTTEREGIAIRARVRTTGRTGAEMEALTAVSVAALTIYDMCKAVDGGMVIEGVRLETKTQQPPDALPIA
jgi:cyclic pyranopterin phosphate synthase